jgi:hypothetical protein
MSEVITNEKNGLLFEPGSPEDLAAKISRILDEPGLLQNLSSQCRLPKSIPQYVEEILAIYKSPPVIQSRGGIVNYENHPPMDPKSEASFITGWCVVGGGQPAVVELYAGDQLVVQTCQFQLRPDVSLGLKKAGLPIQGNLFGFSLSFTTGVERSSVSIRICSEIGHSVSLPIGLLEYGSMVTVEEGCYIGLESEYFG